MSLAFKNIQRHTIPVIQYRSDTYHSECRSMSMFQRAHPTRGCVLRASRYFDTRSKQSRQWRASRVLSVWPHSVRKHAKSSSLMMLSPPAQARETPSVRSPGCPRRPRCLYRLSLIAHRCSWCTAPQVVLALQRCRQCCRCQETHRSGQVSFLKRTGVVH